MSSCRAIGFGAEGRIPYLAIRAFATDSGITDPDEFRWFLAMIREMDSQYLGTRSALAKAHPDADPKVVDSVSVSNPAGVRGLLSRLGKKPKAEPPPEPISP